MSPVRPWPGLPYSGVISPGVKVSGKRANAVARQLWIERHGSDPVCVKCGRSADIHHIDGNKRNNAESNHMPLCRSHHISLENRLRCWVTNGAQAKKVMAVELPGALAAGWTRGRVLHPVVASKVLKRNTHGTSPCYRRGCRCNECVSAGRTWMRDIKRRYRAVRLVGGVRSPRLSV